MPIAEQLTPDEDLMEQTAMAQAFAKVGIAETAADRAMHLAMMAWGRYQKSSDGSARREYVMDGLRGEMTFALVEAWDRNALGQAIGQLLNKAREEIARQRPKRDAAEAAGGGHVKLGTQLMNAPATTPGVKPADDRGQAERDAQISPAPVVTQFRDAGASRQSDPASPPPTSRLWPPGRSNLTVLADKQAAAAVARVSVELRLSKLDTVFIGDKKIGDCTVGEVKLWAAKRVVDGRNARRDARFANALTANMPDGAVIRHHWQNPTEVDKIYANAEVEHAA